MRLQGSAKAIDMLVVTRETRLAFEQLSSQMRRFQAELAILTEKLMGWKGSEAESKAKQKSQDQIFDYCWWNSAGDTILRSIWSDSPDCSNCTCQEFWHPKRLCFFGTSQGRATAAHEFGLKPLREKKEVGVHHGFSCCISVWAIEVCTVTTFDCLMLLNVVCLAIGSAIKAIKPKERLLWLDDCMNGA